ncbi:MAG: hypothetical protein ABI145_19610 [Steroidobacteraceae bacterium]
MPGICPSFPRHRVVSQSRGGVAEVLVDFGRYERVIGCDVFPYIRAGGALRPTPYLSLVEHPVRLRQGTHFALQEI